jgi:predicted NACHT family NTPase
MGLQATPDGRKQAKVALAGLKLNQQKLADRLDVTRQPIGKFFTGKSVSDEVFVRICEVLKLDWKLIADIAGPLNPPILGAFGTNPGSAPPNLGAGGALAIATLVAQTREAIRPLIQEQCSTMKVLDMPQPIELTGENGICISVNILEKLTKLRTEEDLSQAMWESQGLDDRFGLGRSMERLPGLNVVQNHPRLMVLGKPGAGKTTFLKSLAIQCITGEFAADKVPFFVTLKDFAEFPESPSLVEYLARSLPKKPSSEGSHQITPIENVELLLQSGRSFILLDGLDEVSREDTKRIIYEIRSVVELFYQSSFVITCRIAAQEYVFQKFTEVEVADFDEQQIITFAENWFRAKKDFPKATIFVQKLLQNDPIRELASNPLLLTLLCLVFGEDGEFPNRRADLYESGVKILLKRWDATRGIQRRNLYEKLDIQRREDLLSYVAFQAFWRGQLILKKREIESYIACFLKNLKNFDPEMLQTDSEAVLESIQAHHGLLVQRANGFYSFSHLTLQEYFTAREISLTNQPTIQTDLFEILTRNFSNPKWREVFLLTMELLRNASDLVLEIKRDIDAQLAYDQKLQDFLQWVEEKSSSVSTHYKPSVVRAFYYSLLLSFGYDLAWKIDSDFDYNTCPEFKLDYTLNFILNRARARAAVSINYYLADTLKLAEDSGLKNKLQELYNRLPDDWSNLEEIRQWKLANEGQLWVEDLREIMIDYRSISSVPDFTVNQRELLKQHYQSNLFLWECLNTDCYIDRNVREQIEETLLLPIKRIKEIGI